VRRGAAKAGSSTLGTILRPRPAAAARAASTQRGRMYLKSGERELVAAAALRTAHWPAPWAPYAWRPATREEGRDPRDVPVTRGKLPGSHLYQSGTEFFT